MASRDATGEATPRPWRVSGDDVDRPAIRADVCHTAYHSGCVVAYIPSIHEPGRSRADAELIVRAVNHHDAMRAFIHDLMSQASACSSEVFVRLNHEYWAERAKALLACVDDCASPSVEDAR